MLNILLIEDDASIRKSMTVFLEDEEYNVVAAEDGDQGCGLFHTGDFDVVLVDLFMPGKDGLETIQDIRSVDTKVKIIAMSGIMRGQYAEAASETGADEVFSKPIDMDRFLEVLQSYHS